MKIFSSYLLTYHPVFSFYNTCFNSNNFYHTLIVFLPHYTKSSVRAAIVFHCPLLHSANQAGMLINHSDSRELTLQSVAHQHRMLLEPTQKIQYIWSLWQ